jgi:hypothetical protein
VGIDTEHGRKLMDRKTIKVLRQAAYWLTDYANCFRNAPEPGAAKFRDQLRAIAAKCRKEAGRSSPPATERT